MYALHFYAIFPAPRTFFILSGIMYASLFYEKITSVIFPKPVGVPTNPRALAKYMAKTTKMTEKKTYKNIFLKYSESP